jgi:hypothetical protein
MPCAGSQDGGLEVGSTFHLCSHFESKQPGSGFLTKIAKEMELVAQ